jgi:EpsI family protein
MIARRFFILDVALVLGLSAIFFLPKAQEASPAGIAVKLPIWVGDWLGEDGAVTPRELEVLAKDTQFARKVYTSPAGEKVFVSIVLSGEDMTSSIHRPERCLPAQGWSMQSSSQRTIPIDQSTSLAATRLSNARVVDTKDKQHLTFHNLTYYWFVGYTQTTPSHLTRTLLDMRDRILRGYNQRWAYITVAANVPEGSPQSGPAEAKVDAMIERFIAKLVPKLERPDATSPSASNPRTNKQS